MNKIEKTYKLPAFIFILVVVFSFARLLWLDADFPSEIGNWSSDLYTDEGWYSNSAVRKVTFGHWILQGDFNPVINLPVFQFGQYIIFKIFGTGLLQARIGGFLWFLLLQFSLFMFVKKLSNQISALTTVLFVAINPFIFAYSRLAFLEIPMSALFMVSLWLIVEIKSTTRPIIFLIPGLIFGTSMLVKTSAIFCLPLAIVLIFITTKKRGFINSVSFLVGWFLIWGGYTFWAKSTFPLDFEFFQRLNFNQRLSLMPVSIITNLINSVSSEFLTHQPTYWLTVITAIGFAFTKVRNNPLYQIYILWLLLSLGLISLSDYQPGRYFVPLIIGTCGLTAFGFNSLVGMIMKTARRIILLLLVFLLVFQAVVIASWLSQPTYSFLTMIRRIESQLTPDASGEIVIMGQFSNTIGLEVPVKTINELYGTINLESKITKFKPNYYISLGEFTYNKEISDILLDNYNVDFIESYDVFNNYSGGKKVYLYKLKIK